MFQRQALTAILAAALVAGALGRFGMAAQTGSDHGVYKSLQDVEDYLQKALPAATAANPKYLTKSSGVESRWLTRGVRFEDASNGVRVTMDEEFTQDKDGKREAGTHRASFTLDSVELTIFTETGDVTPNGEPSMGILFTCAAPGCITASWNGNSAPADKTDISLQDEAERLRIFDAFGLLKTRGVHK